MKDNTHALRFLFVIIFSFSTFELFAQSLSVSLASGTDTTGLSTIEQLALERSVTLNLSGLGSGGDTLVVELGSESGSYDLFTRRFPLTQTGTFDDGCSLNSSGGLTAVGLGNYTGLDSFFVRSYLSSAGVGSASIVSNE